VVVEDIWRRKIRRQTDYLYPIETGDIWLGDVCPVCGRPEETVYNFAPDEDRVALHWSSYMDCFGGSGEAAIKCDRCGCWFVIDIST